MPGETEPDSSPWFTYLLEPDRLTSDLDGSQTPDLCSLLVDLLSNLLNNQATTAGLFTDNPQELWYGKSTEKAERKSLVLRTLSLRVAACYSWQLTKLETDLPPPLLLYLLTTLVQAQPGQQADQEGQISLADTRSHPDMDLLGLSSPGPALQSLTLLHRWIVRTFMTVKTPQRTERTSTVMVPGVKRDPAILFRDQTHTLVFAVVQTSIKFLARVLECEAASHSIPSHHSFPTMLSTTGPGYFVSEWDISTLKIVDKSLFLAQVSYDLACCYFFCEDYSRAKSCFSSYFNYSNNMTIKDPTLGGEVDSSRLAGYLLCLGMESPTTPLAVSTSLADHIAAADVRGYEGLAGVLVDHTVNDTGDGSSREMMELDMTAGGAPPGIREVYPSVMICNLVRRTLRGYPITVRVRHTLSKLPESRLAVLDKILTSLIPKSTPGQQKLLLHLVMELVLYNIVSPTSKSATLLLEKDSLASLLSNPYPRGTKGKHISFQLDPMGQEKVSSLNNSLQLITTFSPGQVTTLSNGFGTRTARKLSSRWFLESDLLGRQNAIPDIAFILLAKVNQLKQLKRWSDTKQLLSAVQTELRGGVGGKVAVSPPPWLGGHLEGEQLLADIQGLEEGRKVGEEEILTRCGVWLSSDQTGSPSLVQSCIVCLLSAGDWEGVGRLSHTNMPYVVTSKANNSSSLPVIALARNLSFLMLNLRTNNHQMVKKFGRDVWDSVSNLVSTTANKRQKTDERHTAQATLSRDRSLVTAFFQRVVVHPGLSAVVLSLLASQFNVARDDPNTDLLSVHSSVWPTGLATNQAIQERTTEEMLNSVLTSALSFHPKEPSLLRISADLQFANSRYAASLSLYVESVAVRSDYFSHDCGPPQSMLEEAVVARLITCCKELGRLTQAVVLCQFSPEPNYAQAFKFLEDQTEDGGDSLYGCIWDMAILEFAMSLHTRRGEMARRREAKHCIWQLELNTNNEEEIIKEAANVRKSMFLRSLALQFF